MKFTLHLRCLDDYLECSLEPLMLFLHNSLILKFLRIDYVYTTSSLVPQTFKVKLVYYSSLVVFRMWLLAARISHFRGTNQVLYQDACCPILRSLCGKVLEEEEDKRENVWLTSLQTQSVLKTARISPICYYNLEKKEKTVGGHKIYV